MTFTIDPFSIDPLLLYPLSCFLSLKTLILLIQLILDLKSMWHRKKDMEVLLNALSIAQKTQEGSGKVPTSWLGGGGMTAH